MSFQYAYLGLVTVLLVSACAPGTPVSNNANSRLQGDVDPVGELGTFQLLSPTLPPELAARTFEPASFKIAGISVVPDGNAVRVRPGSHCLVASFPSVIGRPNIELEACGIEVAKAKETKYTLAAFLPQVSNAEVDFGLKPWFRLEGLAMNVSGSKIYRLPALQGNMRAELASVEGARAPYTYRSEPSHALSDLSLPVVLQQGEVKVVNWELPERRRSVTVSIADEAKYPFATPPRLQTSTGLPSTGRLVSEFLNVENGKPKRFFPDLSVDKVQLCGTSRDCSEVPPGFLKGAGSSPVHTLRAEIFNFHAFESGTDGRVSLSRVAESGNIADDVLVENLTPPPFSALLLPGTYRAAFWRADQANQLVQVGETIIEAAR